MKVDLSTIDQVDLVKLLQYTYGGHFLMVLHRSITSVTTIEDLKASVDFPYSYRLYYSYTFMVDNMLEDRDDWCIVHNKPNGFGYDVWSYINVCVRDKKIQEVLE